MPSAVPARAVNAPDTGAITWRGIQSKRGQYRRGNTVTKTAPMVSNICTAEVYGSVGPQTTQIQNSKTATDGADYTEQILPKQPQMTQMTQIKYFRNSRR
jgi:biotin synthase-like enzyme